MYIFICVIVFFFVFLLGVKRQYGNFISGEGMNEIINDVGINCQLRGQKGDWELDFNFINVKNEILKVL